jgi:hypothetical protein
MRFNEWISQNNKDFDELSSNLGIETKEEEGLIENQLDQWVNKLMGLLHTVPSNRKQKLLEKVINKITSF